MRLRASALENVDVRGTTEAFLDAGGWQLRRGRFISDLDHEIGGDACVATPTT